MKLCSSPLLAETSGEILLYHFRMGHARAEFSLSTFKERGDRSVTCWVQAIGRSQFARFSIDS